MLTSTRRARGFTIIELIVVVALIGILMAMGIPTIANWMADARLRATAESLTNAVRFAQANAIARNRETVVVLTNAAPAYNAAPAAGGTNWYVLLDPLSSETYSTASGSESMIQSSTEARQHGVTLATSNTYPLQNPAVLCFNAMGQLTKNLTTALPSATACADPTTVSDVASTSAATTVNYLLTRTNAVRQFRVMVSNGGRVRMCDAMKTLSTTNPDGCPP